MVCVQNFYNIANRADVAVLAATAEQRIAYVPYFPLGGFSPLQSDVLESVAKRLGATPTDILFIVTANVLDTIPEPLKEQNGHHAFIRVYYPRKN